MSPGPGSRSRATPGADPAKALHGDRAQVDGGRVHRLADLGGSRRAPGLPAEHTGQLARLALAIERDLAPSMTTEEVATFVTA